MKTLVKKKRTLHHTLITLFQARLGTLPTGSAHPRVTARNTIRVGSLREVYCL